MADTVASAFTEWAVSLDPAWFATERGGFKRDETLSWKAAALRWAAKASMALQAAGASTDPRYTALGASYNVMVKRVAEVDRLYPPSNAPFREGQFLRDYREGWRTIAANVPDLPIPGGWSTALIAGAVLIAVYAISVIKK